MMAFYLERLAAQFIHSLVAKTQLYVESVENGKQEVVAVYKICNLCILSELHTSLFT
jgi:hypothetical protein